LGKKNDIKKKKSTQDEDTSSADERREVGGPSDVGNKIQRMILFAFLLSLAGNQWRLMSEKEREVNITGR
jgi:hypothetical protein